MSNWTYTHKKRLIWNQIIFIIFRLVPNQSQNSEHNLISVDLTRIRNQFFCVYTVQFCKFINVFIFMGPLQSVKKIYLKRNQKYLLKSISSLMHKRICMYYIIISNSLRARRNEIAEGVLAERTRSLFSACIYWNRRQRIKYLKMVVYSLEKTNCLIFISWINF